MKHFSPLWSLLPGAALIAGCGNPSKKETADTTRQKPNVIYLIADDLGIGDLSCYGATKISTPNIDRLAGQGVQFTNAYATSSTSTPSRFGLLTGMYPWRQENTGIAPGNSELIIDTACVTMADMFKAEGYATGAVGKWHLGLGPKGGTDFNHLIKPNTHHNVPLKINRETNYSKDKNLWHLSHEGLDLEDPKNEPLYEKPGFLEMGVSPIDAPDIPTYIEIEFEKGIPVALDGEKMSAKDIILELNKLGGENGIGLLDIVENRLVGMKCRGVYEDLQINMQKVIQANAIMVVVNMLIL